MSGKRTNKKRFNKANIGKTAPASSGCYEIVNSKGESLYVGKSNNIQRRLEEHLRDKDIRGAHSFRTYKPPPGMSSEKFEDRLMRNKKPKKNRRPW